MSSVFFVLFARTRNDLFLFKIFYKEISLQCFISNLTGAQDFNLNSDLKLNFYLKNKWKEEI